MLSECGKMILEKMRLARTRPLQQNQPNTRNAHAFSEQILLACGFRKRFWPYDHNVVDVVTALNVFSTHGALFADCETSMKKSLSRPPGFTCRKAACPRLIKSVTRALCWLSSSESMVALHAGTDINPSFPRIFWWCATHSPPQVLGLEVLWFHIRFCSTWQHNEA